MDRSPNREFSQEGLDASFSAIISIGGAVGVISFDQSLRRRGEMYDNEVGDEEGDGDDNGGSGGNGDWLMSGR